MKVSVISENTSTLDDGFIERFGFGTVFRINGKNIMVDCGPDESFIGNLQRLNIPVQDIDMCIISHGHYDHGGGLPAFLERNKKAKVYLSEKCMHDYFSNNLQTGEYKYIGLDHSIFGKYSDRIVRFAGDLEIDENVSLFGIKKNAKNFYPKMNANLYIKTNGEYVHDSFDHEIAVLLSENGKNAIVTGCAHSGVTNMIETVIEKAKIRKIDALIGGFHLVNPGTKKLGENEENVIRLAADLKKYDIGIILTGHCTGTDGYEIIKKQYERPIVNITTGFETEIPIKS